MPTNSAVSLMVFFSFSLLYLVNMIVRPLVVEITFNNQPLSADRNYDIECQAIGSRPPAKITWWLSGEEVEGRSQTVRYLLKDLGVFRSASCVTMSQNVSQFLRIRHIFAIKK